MYIITSMIHTACHPWHEHWNIHSAPFPLITLNRTILQITTMIHSMPSLTWTLECSPSTQINLSWTEMWDRVWLWVQVWVRVRVRVQCKCGFEHVQVLLRKSVSASAGANKYGFEHRMDGQVERSPLGSSPCQAQSKSAKHQTGGGRGKELNTQ